MVLKKALGVVLVSVPFIPILVVVIQKMGVQALAVILLAIVVVFAGIACVATGLVLLIDD